MLLLTSGPKLVPVSGVSQLASQCATRKQRPCVVLSGVWWRSGSTVRERRGGGEARVQAGRDGWRKSGRCDVPDKKSMGPAEREGVASSGVWRAIKTFRFRTGSGGRRSARSWRAGGLQEELCGGALVKRRRS